MNTGDSFPWAAFAGQPAQADPPTRMFVPPLTVGTGFALAGGAEPGAADAEPDAEDDADVVPPAAAGWFGPPGLAATVPHPAASAPAASSGRERARARRASRAIEAMGVFGVVI